MKKNSIFRKARLLAQKGLGTREIINKLGLTKQPTYIKHRVASAVSYERGKLNKTIDGAVKRGKTTSNRVEESKISLVEFCLVPARDLGVLSARYNKVYFSEAV